MSFLNVYQTAWKTISVAKNNYFPTKITHQRETTPTAQFPAGTAPKLPPTPPEVMINRTGTYLHPHWKGNQLEETNKSKNQATNVISQKKRNNDKNIGPGFLSYLRVPGNFVPGWTMEAFRGSGKKVKWELSRILRVIMAFCVTCSLLQLRLKSDSFFQTRNQKP